MSTVLMWLRIGAGGVFLLAIMKLREVFRLAERTFIIPRWTLFIGVSE
jgi:hypothetical protein